jgi:hypothetical protein
MTLLLLGAAAIVATVSLLALTGCAPHQVVHGLGGSMTIAAPCLRKPLHLTGCNRAHPPQCKHLDPIVYLDGCEVLEVAK